ncbi:STAS domain-containing protein [Chondromyces apiculatus]|uniref:RsbS, negative regulator of sigma-B n=1 Tax=Chondromyces apiculatus DSM 436 TaxID=1192034 RepID=A0A017TEZ8_9BACT|nr:STAS domain-containing protein [Chondromyces apiculatus]EYF07873.1 RsbS, negative regulator of sigma-B [Chondromyces apiculatus DSM 436]
MELKRLPIINLWDRILVPLQGDVTDDLAEQLNTDVLRAIHESGAKGLVIDLTGVWIMDSHLCAVLTNLAAAARLMGTPTILSGLSPEIAMTLQAMGVELAAVRTALTLEQALTMLGLEVWRAEDSEVEDEGHDEPQEEAQGARPRAAAPAGFPGRALGGQGRQSTSPPRLPPTSVPARTRGRGS